MKTNTKKKRYKPQEAIENTENNNSNNAKRQLTTHTHSHSGKRCKYLLDFTRAIDVGNNKRPNGARAGTKEIEEAELSHPARTKRNPAPSTASAPVPVPVTCNRKLRRFSR